MTRILYDKIFEISGHDEFSELALDIFEYQYRENSVYREFIECLGIEVKRIKTPAEIPFLPVEFFRNRKIVSNKKAISKVFQSSGTTMTNPGKHFVSDLNLYEKSFLNAFKIFYGDPSGYLICAMLPSYTERENSSLIYMVRNLIQQSGSAGSGFYKDDGDKLRKVIEKAKKESKKVLLLGVSFALLDFAERHSSDFSEVIVMETGGMKGRRKEVTRQELHSILKEKFNVDTIHSEYGMTELLSQAYSKGDGIFYCPPWMKILIRDPLDPLTIYEDNLRSGGINVIDLANINSCSFISTSDLGKLREDGGFEVLGRFDNSDIRGCNLLVE